MDYNIHSIQSINNRVGGSVSFFDGLVMVPGREAPLHVRFSTKITETDYDKYRTDKFGEKIWLPDGLIEACIEREVALAESAAIRVAEDSAKYAPIRTRLQPLKGVSEKQEKFAEATRDRTVCQLFDMYGRAADVEPFWLEVISETAAKFWLDHCSWFLVKDILINRAKARQTAA